MNKCFIVCICFFIGSFVLFSCKEAGNPVVTNWYEDMRITDEFSGWVDEPANYQTFDTANAYDVLDGGAGVYLDNGLIDGLIQLLYKTGTDNSCQVTIHNFGVASKATKMFNDNAALVSSKVILTEYDESIVVGDETLGGATFFAHFGQYQLELGFSGYTDTDAMKTDALMFLQEYESKIGLSTRPL